MWRSRAGTQIEEPFATLPLDAYCEMMSRHAKEQYERRRGVFPHLAILQFTNVCVAGISGPAMYYVR